MKLDKRDFNVAPIDRLEAINKAYNNYERYPNLITNREHMVVVDFTQPSWKKRLYVVNVDTRAVVSTHHVAHGEASSDHWDKAKSVYFSNTPESHKSSLGAMLTAEVYEGKHGKSRRLEGLEKGINDNVRRRVIVIHPANYVTDEYIHSAKRAGCSWGCLALDPAISSSFIDLAKKGTFVYCYGVKANG